MTKLDKLQELGFEDNLKFVASFAGVVKKSEKKEDILDLVSLVILLLNKLKKETTKAIEEIPRAEKGDKGDSIKGEPGYTPIKGVDYFDGENGYTPIKGKDYFDGKDGENGKDADEEAVAEKACEMAEERVKTLIPSVSQVVEQVGLELPQLGEAMRDGLELLPDGEKLSIDAIQDLREKLDELERKIVSGNGKTMYVAGAGSGGKTMYVYDLSGQLDGVTKVFNIPAFWRVITVQSTSFPVTFRPTVDYTTDASASTLTFTSEIEASTTLASGQTVIITYSV